MKLTKIGFFCEMPHAESNDPSIKDYIGNLTYRADINKICDYLNNGVALAVCPGTVNDVINPDKGIAGCPHLLTDGVYVWPGDYSYYVKNYHVSVEADFYEHMKSNNWIITFDIDSVDFDSIIIGDNPAFS